MNLQSLLLLALLAGTPLLLAVLGELVVELSGMINIGLEGLLLIGAMSGVAFATLTGSTAAGFLGGIAGALLGSLLFGWLTIQRRGDQIICGAGLNFIAVGLTGAIYSLHSAAFVSGVPRMAPLVILGRNCGDLVALASWLIVPTAIFVLTRRTRFGLRLRACGEYPQAARLHGIGVERYRWTALALEGVLCGVGGAYISLVLSSGFAENMVAGRGFIALAIVTFGRWRSLGSILGVALFSVTLALQYSVQANWSFIPFHLLLASPYLLTLFVMLLFVREVRAPEWLGRVD